MSYSWTAADLDLYFVFFSSKLKLSGIPNKKPSFSFLTATVQRENVVNIQSIAAVRPETSQRFRLKAS